MGAKKLNYSVCIDAVFRESKLSFVEAMSVIHRLGYRLDGNMKQLQKA